jgi:hypothetical protein
MMKGNTSAKDTQKRGRISCDQHNDEKMSQAVQSNAQNLHRRINGCEIGTGHALEGQCEKLR